MLFGKKTMSLIRNYNESTAALDINNDHIHVQNDWVMINKNEIPEDVNHSPSAINYYPSLLSAENMRYAAQVSTGGLLMALGGTSWYAGSALSYVASAAKSFAPYLIDTGVDTLKKGVSTFETSKENNVMATVACGAIITGTALATAGHITKNCALGCEIVGPALEFVGQPTYNMGKNMVNSAGVTAMAR